MGILVALQYHIFRNTSFAFSFAVDLFTILSYFLDGSTVTHTQILQPFVVVLVLNISNAVSERRRSCGLGVFTPEENVCFDPLKCHILSFKTVVG